MKVKLGVLIADLESSKRTLAEAVAEIERETNLRISKYPEWIEKRKLASLDAVDRLERIAKAGQILTYLLDLPIEKVASYISLLRADVTGTKPAGADDVPTGANPAKETDLIPSP